MAMATPEDRDDMRRRHAAGSGAGAQAGPRPDQAERINAQRAKPQKPSAPKAGRLKAAANSIASDSVTDLAKRAWNAIPGPVRRVVKGGGVLAGLQTVHEGAKAVADGFYESDIGFDRGARSIEAPYTRETAAAQRAGESGGQAGVVETPRQPAAGQPRQPAAIVESTTEGGIRSFSQPGVSDIPARQAGPWPASTRQPGYGSRDAVQAEVGRQLAADAEDRRVKVQARRDRELAGIQDRSARYDARKRAEEHLRDAKLEATSLRGGFRPRGTAGRIATLQQRVIDTHAAPSTAPGIGAEIAAVQAHREGKQALEAGRQAIDSEIEQTRAQALENRRQAQLASLQEVVLTAPEGSEERQRAVANLRALSGSSPEQDEFTILDIPIDGGVAGETRQVALNNRTGQIVDPLQMGAGQGIAAPGAVPPKAGEVRHNPATGEVIKFDGEKWVVQNRVGN